MVTGTRVIDGKTYTFDSKGLLISSEDDYNKPVPPSTPTSERTVKNYLLNALQPVGRTLYIWGGGHNDTDSTRKGISLSGHHSSVARTAITIIIIIDIRQNSDLIAQDI